MVKKNSVLLPIVFGLAGGIEAMKMNPELVALCKESCVYSDPSNGKHQGNCDYRPPSLHEDQALILISEKHDDNLKYFGRSVAYYLNAACQKGSNDDTNTTAASPSTDSSMAKDPYDLMIQESSECDLYDQECNYHALLGAKAGLMNAMEAGKYTGIVLNTNETKAEKNGHRFLRADKLVVTGGKAISNALYLGSRAAIQNAERRFSASLGNQIKNEISTGFERIYGPRPLLESIPGQRPGDLFQRPNEPQINAERFYGPRPIAEDTEGLKPGNLYPAEVRIDQILPKYRTFEGVAKPDTVQNILWDIYKNLLADKLPSSSLNAKWQLATLKPILSGNHANDNTRLASLQQQLQNGLRMYYSGYSSDMINIRLEPYIYRSGVDITSQVKGDWYTSGSSPLVFHETITSTFKNDILMIPVADVKNKKVDVLKIANAFDEAYYPQNPSLGSELHSIESIVVYFPNSDGTAVKVEKYFVPEGFQAGKGQINLSEMVKRSNFESTAMVFHPKEDGNQVWTIRTTASTDSSIGRTIWKFTERYNTKDKSARLTFSQVEHLSKPEIPEEEVEVSLKRQGGTVESTLQPTEKKSMTFSNMGAIKPTAPAFQKAPTDFSWNPGSTELPRRPIPADLPTYDINGGTKIKPWLQLPLRTLVADGKSLSPKVDEILYSARHIFDADGVVVEIPWGYVETAEKTYDWGVFETLIQKASKVSGMRIKISLNFYGMDKSAPIGTTLPTWIENGLNPVQASNLFYKSNGGRVINKSVLSEGASAMRLGALQRTPDQIYADFLDNFLTKFSKERFAITDIKYAVGPNGNIGFPKESLGIFEGNPKLTQEWESISNFAGDAKAVDAFNEHLKSNDAVWLKKAYEGGDDVARLYVEWMNTMLLESTEKIVESANQVLRKHAVPSVRHRQNQPFSVYKESLRMSLGLENNFNPLDLNRGSEAIRGYLVLENFNTYQEIVKKLITNNWAIEINARDLERLDATKFLSEIGKVLSETQKSELLHLVIDPEQVNLKKADELWSLVRKSSAFDRGFAPEQVILKSNSEDAAVDNPLIRAFNSVLEKSADIEAVNLRLLLKSYRHANNLFKWNVARTNTQTATALVEKEFTSTK